MWFEAVIRWGLILTLAWGLPLAHGQTGKVPDTLTQRMQACTICHGKEGVATQQGYFPRIAGKPADYLYQQLLNFREGRRSNTAMLHLIENMSDAYLLEIARYFGALDLPYPAALQLSTDQEMLIRGERLVRNGDVARGIPSCVSCHGASMTGRLPATPGLLGLPRDYVVAQVGAWQTGLRKASPPDCMAKVAKLLTAQDLFAVSIWLAAQPVPGNGRPLPFSPQKSSIACKGDPP